MSDVVLYLLTVVERTTATDIKEIGRRVVSLFHNGYDLFVNNKTHERGRQMDTVEIASKVELELHGKNGWNEKRAKFYTVNVDELGGVSVEFASENGDVYELLDNPLVKSLAQTPSTQFIALLTCGWASPIDEGNGADDDEGEIAPSQHPLRRRVRLVVVASKDSVASVLRFQDDDENTVTDQGKARGSLADAVNGLFHR